MSSNPLPKPKLEYSQFSIEEPLTSDMKKRIRLELTKYYQSFRKTVYGRNIKYNWTTGVSEVHGMCTLKDPMPLHSWTLKKFCNKPTAFY